MIKAFIAALGRLIDVWPSVSVRGYSHANELEALRADTQRIGNDMRKVMLGQWQAQPVDGPVNIADLRCKVTARHQAVRAYLAKN